MGSNRGHSRQPTSSLHMHTHPWIHAHTHTHTCVHAYTRTYAHTHVDTHSKIQHSIFSAKYRRQTKAPFFFTAAPCCGQSRQLQHQGQKLYSTASASQDLTSENNACIRSQVKSNSLSGPNLDIRLPRVCVLKGWFLAWHCRRPRNLEELNLVGV